MLCSCPLPSSHLTQLLGAHAARSLHVGEVVGCLLLLLQSLELLLLLQLLRLLLLELLEGWLLEVWADQRLLGGALDSGLGAGEGLNYSLLLFGRTSRETRGRVHWDYSDLGTSKGVGK